MDAEIQYDWNAKKPGSMHNCKFSGRNHPMQKELCSQPGFNVVSGVYVMAEVIFLPSVKKENLAVYMAFQSKQSLIMVNRMTAVKVIMNSYSVFVIALT